MIIYLSLIFLTWRCVKINKERKDCVLLRCALKEVPSKIAWLDFSQCGKFPKSKKSRWNELNLNHQEHFCRNILLRRDYNLVLFFLPSPFHRLHLFRRHPNKSSSDRVRINKSLVSLPQVAEEVLLTQTATV